MELIVVHNGQEDNRVRSTVSATAPTARYYNEPRQGLNWARNRGLSVANMPYVAFVDDDTLVDDSWLAAIQGALHEDPEIGGLTGLVLPAELRTCAQVMFERYASFNRGFVRRWWQSELITSTDPTLRLRTWEVGTGANIVLSKRAVEAVGGFDPAFDTGSMIIAAGDLEVFYRLLRAGYEIRYEPTALAWHIHRADYAALRRQVTSFGSFACFVESVLRADPSEFRTACHLARWMINYFRWRFSASSKSAECEFARDLVWAELLGYTQAVFGRRYVRARHKAVAQAKQGDFGVARRYLPPQPQLSGYERRHMDLCEAVNSAIRVASPGLVVLDVYLSNRRIGCVEIVTATRTVPPTRVRDAIVQQLWPWLLTDELREFAPELLIEDSLRSEGCGGGTNHGTMRAE